MTLMKFNSTDKSTSLIADIDFLIWGDSSTFNSTYSLADRTRNINNAYDEVIALIFNTDPNFKWDDSNNTDFPIATLDLSSSLDHYTLPDSALIIHRVRIKDSSGSFRTLEPVERRELSDHELNTTGTPSKYYKLGGTVFPVVAPNYSVSGGIEIEFQRGGNHFSTSDTDNSAGFNSQFHRFLSVSASLDYAIANGLSKKIAQLRAEKDKIKAEIRLFYLTRSKDEKPNISLKKKSYKRFGL